MQFAWYFRYPGPDAIFGAVQPRLASAPEGNPLGIDPGDPNGHDDVVSSDLILPQGREVDLRLRAQDVIHGFAIPEMRLKQNAVPGETVHVHFTPVKTGTYAILCTQLCGSGHYRMNATLQVVPEEQFKAWLRARTKAAQP
jgi:cytochrome c oxidase subunit 2